jgi:hypothetical protein
MDYFNINLKNLCQRVKSYKKFHEWKLSLIEIELEPNDEDDEQIEFEIPIEKDGIKMIELKNSLNNDFIVLTDINFHSFTNNADLSVVLFHLPCIEFLFFI